MKTDGRVKKNEHQDCITVETVGEMTEDDHHYNIVDEASSANGRNDITESLRQFQKDLDRRMVARSQTMLSPQVAAVPNNNNVRRTSTMGSTIQTFDSLATCLSDGDGEDEDDDIVSEMIFKISNHFETPRKDVSASLKAFHLDIDFVKKSEEKHHPEDVDDDDDVDEDYSEALSFAEDSVASGSPKLETNDMPATSIATSFPPAPPLTTDPDVPTRMDLYSNLSMKALKVELEVCGVSTEGFLEKPDFVKALENYKQAESETMKKSKQTTVPTVGHTEVEPKTDISPITPIKYVTNEKVLYVSSNGEKEIATILKVHLDDDHVPFYDIRLHSSGREKQTDDAHLTLLPARKMSRSSKSAKQPPRRSSTTSVRSSTEYSYTSEDLSTIDLASPKPRATDEMAFQSPMGHMNSAQKKRRGPKSKLRSMDGLSLSAHPASSQRPTEQVHRRSSVGAIPKAIPKSIRSPQPRKSSSMHPKTPEQRRTKPRPTKMKKKKQSMDGLSLSAHTAGSQRSTPEQPRRRTSQNTNTPKSFLSPSGRSHPKVVKKKRSSAMDGLSLSAHSANSSQRSTSERPSQRISLNNTTTPKSFLSPNAPSRKNNVDLDLSMHSVNSRRSATQPRRRSCVGNTIPPNLFLSPTVRANKPKIVKKSRSMDGLSVSAHASTSQLSKEQPRRRTSMKSPKGARARKNGELSQSLHAPSTIREQPRRRTSLKTPNTPRTRKNGDLSQSLHAPSTSSHQNLLKRIDHSGDIYLSSGRTHHPKTLRRSASAQNCRLYSHQEEESMERGSSKHSNSYGTLPAFVSPQRKKHSSKPKKHKKSQSAQQVPSSAPTSRTNRRAVSSSSDIPKLVVLDLAIPITPSNNTKPKRPKVFRRLSLDKNNTTTAAADDYKKMNAPSPRKSTPESIFSKAKKLVKVG